MPPHDSEYPLNSTRPRKRSRSENLRKACKYLDLVSFLSSSSGGGYLIRHNGERVALHRDTFKGKHVLVCCFHVPIVVDWRTERSQALLNLCNELYSTRKGEDDFEMVVVVRNNGLEPGGKYFHRFFSGFPKSCLVVPVEESERCDYICKELDLGVEVHDSLKLLWVNAKGQVDPDSCFEREVFYKYGGYGAEAFPFTEKVIMERDAERWRLEYEKGVHRLEAVLRCDESSPDFLYKFGTNQETMSISRLSDLSDNSKHVGLLLCCVGDLIPCLVMRYEECMEEQLDFEVVVVCMPFFRNAKGVKPDIFKKKMDGLLRKHIDVCRDWWCLPFNNSVSRRFWRMTGGHFNGWDEGNIDKLIVVGPGVDRLDIYGADVMIRGGLDAYPFTTEAAIANHMKKLEKFTLESVFAESGASFKRGNGEVLDDVGGFKGSKVLLWFDFLTEGSRAWESALDKYHDIKKRFGYDEVVFVEVGTNTSTVQGGHRVNGEGVRVIDYEFPICGLKAELIHVSDEERREIESRVPWCVCHSTSPMNTCAQMMELLRLCNVDAGAIGFGDDGRVCYFTRGHLGWYKSDATLYACVEHLFGYDDFRGRQYRSCMLH